MTHITFSWILILLAGANSTIGNLMLKKSRESEYSSFLFSLLDPWFIGGLIFYGFNVILFVKALEYLPVSSAYPVLFGFGFILLALSSNYFLGERISSLQLLGILLTLIGIFLLSFESS